MAAGDGGSAVIYAELDSSGAILSVCGLAFGMLVSVNLILNKMWIRYLDRGLGIFDFSNCGNILWNSNPSS